MKIKLKTLPFLALFVLSTQFLLAQQEPIFSQFWNAKTYYNPAITGVNLKHQITTLGRWQNVGIDGQPITQLLGYAAKLKKLHGGLGFTYMREEIGYSTFNKTKLNYSYHVNLENEAKLAFGLTAGINNLKTNPVWTPPTTVADPNLPDKTNKTGFTADLGIVYSVSKMNISLSCTQLTESRLGDYQEARHFVFMSDFIFGKDEGLQFKPQIFLMSDLVKYTMDLNAMLIWKEKFGLGITYRNNEDIGLALNWDIVKKFRIGYSYDIPFGLQSDFSNGSHTAFLGFLLK